MSMLDAARSLLTSDLVTRVSGKTGESEVAVAKGFSAVIPMVLASLAGRTDDHAFMSQFANLATRTADVDTSTPAGAWANLAAAESIGTAQTWVKSLFGDRVPDVTAGLSRYTGVSNSTASTIMAMAMPLLLHFFGRMMRTENLDAAGLADRISSERQSFVSAVPPELDGLLPGSERSAEMTARTSPEDVIFPMAGRNEEPTRWLVPVILAGLALTGIFWLWGQSGPMHQARNIDLREGGAVGTSGAVVDYRTKKLPDNVSIHVPKGGMEDRFSDYLGTGPVTRSGQSFDFDRIDFDTASAALTAASREQIRNIASILKAYPNTRVTIAGYTDNVGDQNANMELSRSRAEMVSNALREMGIASDRMQVRGYGSENPVASNDTENGRAKNRRVTLSVDPHQ